jgi:hypothetical protein
MIRHILLIKFKDSVKPLDIATAKTLFETIQEKIEGIVSVEWGLNDSTENLNKGFTHSVLMTFVDENARQSYLPHPEHDALKAVFVPLLEDIVIFDYQA